MRRVVLDANVFVSALLRPSGPPGRIVARIIDKRHAQLVVSPAILDEIGATLRSPKLRRLLDLSPHELDAWVRALAVVADVVPGVLDLRVVERDHDDDIYVVAAVEGLAEVVVTGDDDLLSLRHYQDIRFLSPRAFLDELDAGQ